MRNSTVLPTVEVLPRVMPGYLEETNLKAFDSMSMCFAHASHNLIVIRSSESGDVLHTLVGHTSSVTTIRFAKRYNGSTSLDDDPIVFSGDLNGTVCCWSPAASVSPVKVLSPTPESASRIVSIEVIPAGGLLVMVMHENGVCCLWDTRVGMSLWCVNLSTVSNKWTSLSLDPFDLSRLLFTTSSAAYICNDVTVEMPPTKLTKMPILEAETNHKLNAAWYPHHNGVICVTSGLSLMYYDANINRIISKRSAPSRLSEISVVKFTNTHPHIMTALHEDGSVTTWKGDPITCEFAPNAVSDVISWSSRRFHDRSHHRTPPPGTICMGHLDELTCATVTLDGTLWMWRVAPTGTDIAMTTMQSCVHDVPTCQSLSPSRRFLAMSYQSGLVQVLSLVTGAVVTELFPHGSNASSGSNNGVAWCDDDTLVSFMVREHITAATKKPMKRPSSVSKPMPRSGLLFSNEVCLINISSGRSTMLRKPRAPESTPVKTVQACRQFLAIIMAQGLIEIWDVWNSVVLHIVQSNTMFNSFTWGPYILEYAEDETQTSESTTHEKKAKRVDYVNIVHEHCGRAGAKQSWELMQQHAADSKASLRCTFCYSTSEGLVRIYRVDTHKLTPTHRLELKAFPPVTPTCSAWHNSLITVGDDAGRLHMCDLNSRSVATMPPSKTGVGLVNIEFTSVPKGTSSLMMLQRGDTLLEIYNVGTHKPERISEWSAKSNEKVVSCGWVSDLHPYIMLHDGSIHITDIPLSNLNSFTNHKLVFSLSSDARMYLSSILMMGIVPRSSRLKISNQRIKTLEDLCEFHPEIKADEPDNHRILSAVGDHIHLMSDEVWQYLTDKNIDKLERWARISWYLGDHGDALFYSAMLDLDKSNDRESIENKKLDEPTIISEKIETDIDIQTSEGPASPTVDQEATDIPHTDSIESIDNVSDAAAIEAKVIASLGRSYSHSYSHGHGNDRPAENVVRLETPVTLTVSSVIPYTKLGVLAAGLRGVTDVHATEVSKLSSKLASLDALYTSDFGTGVVIETVNIADGAVSKLASPNARLQLSTRSLLLGNRQQAITSLLSCSIEDATYPMAAVLACALTAEPNSVNDKTRSIAAAGLASRGHHDQAIQLLATSKDYDGVSKILEQASRYVCIDDRCYFVRWNELGLVAVMYDNEVAASLWHDHLLRIGDKMTCLLLLLYRKVNRIIFKTLIHQDKDKLKAILMHTNRPDLISVLDTTSESAMSTVGRELWRIGLRNLARKYLSESVWNTLLSKL